eukprot:TRINITY_DN33109_c0_g1_i1.p1 TRINITY_DN33109_c0_g1~~TRINITY_DN33109_c0_g1_i1.p1  ORF type:complete len:242 (-),score=50.02 TRINITY_DN33109_c0_g1_i1:29-688(-)
MPSRAASTGGAAALLRPPTPPPPDVPPPPFFKLDASLSAKERLSLSSTIGVESNPSKGSVLVGGAFRPTREADVAKMLARSGSLPDTRRSGSRPRTGASAGSRSRGKTPGDAEDADTVWRDMASMCRFDHVANLMQQPLPTRGWDNSDFHRRNKFGPLPQAPEHILATQSLFFDTYRAGKEYERSNRTQRTGPGWHGFPRDFEMEYNEQRVKQSNIMRK